MGRGQKSDLVSGAIRKGSAEDVMGGVGSEE